MSKVGKKKPLKVLFTAYYKITHFFPIQDPLQDPHIRYGEMSLRCSGIRLQRSIDSLSLAYLIQENTRSFQIKREQERFILSRRRLNENRKVVNALLRIPRARS